MTSHLSWLLTYFCWKLHFTAQRFSKWNSRDQQANSIFIIYIFFISRAYDNNNKTNVNRECWTNFFWHYLDRYSLCTSILVISSCAVRDIIDQPLCGNIADSLASLNGVPAGVSYFYMPLVVVIKRSVMPRPTLAEITFSCGFDRSETADIYSVSRSRRRFLRTFIGAGWRLYEVTSHSPPAPLKQTFHKHRTTPAPSPGHFLVTRAAGKTHFIIYILRNIKGHFKESHFARWIRWGPRGRNRGCWREGRERERASGGRGEEERDREMEQMEMGRGSGRETEGERERTGERQGPDGNIIASRRKTCRSSDIKRRISWLRYMFKVQLHQDATSLLCLQS